MSDMIEYENGFEAQYGALRGVAAGLQNAMQEAPAELRPGLQVAINVLLKTAEVVASEGKIEISRFDD